MRHWCEREKWLMLRCWLYFLFCSVFVFIVQDYDLLWPPGARSPHRLRHEIPGRNSDLLAYLLNPVRTFKCFFLTRCSYPKLFSDQSPLFAFWTMNYLLTSAKWMLCCICICSFPAGKEDLFRLNYRFCLWRILYALQVWLVWKNIL